VPNPNTMVRFATFASLYLRLSFCGARGCAYYDHQPRKRAAACADTWPHLRASRQENIDRNKQALAALFTGVELILEEDEQPTPPPARRRPKPDAEVRTPALSPSRGPPPLGRRHEHSQLKGLPGLRGAPVNYSRECLKDKSRRSPCTASTRRFYA
jgi:hypothetical protein